MDDPASLLELLGALSIATDVAAGFPPETAMRTAIIAARLARASGGDATLVRESHTTTLLRYLGEQGLTRIDTTEEAEQAWRDHVMAMYDQLLLGKVKSWFTGFNSNIEGRDTMRPVAYNGGAPRYRRRLGEVAERGYEGFVLA